MTVLTMILLAAIEGAAGILLLSGAGHLLVFEKLFGVTELPFNLLYLCVVLHLGNLIAVLLCYRREVLALLRELLMLLHIVKPPRKKRLSVQRRELVMLLVALVPMLAVPALLGVVSALYAGENLLLFVGLALVLSGVALFFSERFYRGHKDEKNLTPLDALLIGLAQVPAVFPGLSRAALTSSAGVLCGLRRDYAVKFSALLSVPVTLAALVTTAVSAGGSGEMPSFWLCLLGVAVSAAVSFLALKLLQRIAQFGRFDNFSYWCWGAGIISMVLVLIA